MSHFLHHVSLFHSLAPSYKFVSVPAAAAHVEYRCTFPTPREGVALPGSYRMLARFFAIANARSSLRYERLRELD